LLLRICLVAIIFVMLNQSRNFLAAAADRALLGACADVDEKSPYAPLCCKLSTTTVNDFVASRGIIASNPMQARGRIILVYCKSIARGLHAVQDCNSADCVTDLRLILLRTYK
jgi:hypothetical protein